MVVWRASWSGLFTGFNGLFDAFLGIFWQGLRSGFMLAMLRGSPQN
jgi:hypothetical protein